MALHKPPVLENFDEKAKEFVSKATAESGPEPASTPTEVPARKPAKASARKTAGRPRQLDYEAMEGDSVHGAVPVTITLRIPLALKLRVMDYLDNHARRGESMAEMIREGVERELARRTKTKG